MKYETERTAAPSDDDISQVPDHIEEYIRNLEMDLLDATNTIETAYGYLWRDLVVSKFTRDARTRLLKIMDRESQAYGIEAAIAKYGVVSDHEMLMHGP